MLTRRTFAAALASIPVAACHTPPNTPGDAAWREGAALPYAVQEIYAALHLGEIWIAGGFSPASGGATERVIALNLESNQWRDAPALPTPSHHVQLASIDGELYAIGGFIGGATRNSWICTPRVLRLEGESWQESAPLPSPVGEAVSFVHGGRIHLIGGRSPRTQANATWNDHVDVSTHFIFTPGAAEWSVGAPLPTARNSSAGVGFADQLHVISGRTVSGGETGAYDIYTPATDSWRQGPPFPDPRGGLGAALWRDRIVAGGGEILSQSSVGDRLYTLEGDAWTQSLQMPTPRHGHALMAADGALYALGGSRRIATLEALSSMDELR